VADNIAHHSTQIDWAANAANIEEAKRARGYEETTRQSKITIYPPCILRSTLTQVKYELLFNNGYLLRASRMISRDMTTNA
jgi:hypothetical protein